MNSRFAPKTLGTTDAGAVACFMAEKGTTLCNTRTVLGSKQLDRRPSKRAPWSKVA